MKGWFLTSGKFAGDVDRLLGHLPPMEHTLEIIDCSQMSYGIEDGLPAKLWRDGEAVTPPDFFYIVDTDGENGAVFPLARQLEKLGAFNYNSMDGKQTAMSKIATYQALAREGLPIVKTVIFSKNISRESLLEEIGLPMILKPDDGFGGEGVQLIQSGEELDQALLRIRNSDARMLAQKYIATSKGRDVRVLTIGYQAVFAACRQASDPNEFRSNLHMGGTATEYPLTDEMRELCHKVAKTIGLRMAGIDLLFGEDGFVVGEVNSSAGFDSWLGKKDLISVFLKDLTAQMMKMPLPHWRYQQLTAAAEKTQLPQVLLGLDDFSFVKAERALYADCAKTQEMVLMEMVRANKDTEFGKAHHFDEIRTIEDYRRNVPLSDWDDYETYSERLGKGEEDILFPGKPTFFYRTSGTTASYKYIPESQREVKARQAISRARNTEIFLMCSKKVTNRIFAFFNKSSFDVSEGGIQRGTASGRTSELTSPELVAHMTYPPQVVNEFEGRELMYMMLRTSIKYSDVTALLGNNALMMRNLVEYGQEHAEELIEDIRTGGCKYEMSDALKELLKDILAPDPARADELEALYAAGNFTPRYYWPQLMAAGFWLGGSVGVYVDTVRPLLPETTKYIDVGYGASETKINIPVSPETPTGALAVFSSFFEFIPEEGGEPLLAHELEEGKNYEIILTTNSGLYRYRLKDLIHVEGFIGNTPKLYFLTKLTDVANIVQEKIPGSMLLEAVRKISADCGKSCKMAQVYPDSEAARYVICMETEDGASDEGLGKVMDDEMRKHLTQYDKYREKLLHSCEVVWMKAGWSAYLMNKYAKGNATVAQVKVPVVIHELPDKEWIKK